MTPRDMAAIHTQAFAGGQVWSEATFQDFLMDPNIRIDTADHAFCVVRAIAQEAEIITIATDPQHQGQGQGSLVLADVLSRAGREEWTEIFLEVADDNTAAHALYAKFGFRKVGRRKNYYQRGDGSRVDALMLQWSAA